MKIKLKTLPLISNRICFQLTIVSNVVDGTAQYQAVAAVFISQALGMDLTIGDQVTIILTTVLASIGTAAVPSAGTITLVIILQQFGLPLEAIGIILAVDRILDMLRTSVNVTGDAAVACIVANSEGLLDKNIYNKYSSYKNCHFVLYEELTNQNYTKSLLEKINLSSFDNANLNFFKKSNVKEININHDKKIIKDAMSIYESYTKN